jgi:hypothetical protein
MGMVIKGESVKLFSWTAKELTENCHVTNFANINFYEIYSYCKMRS